MSFLLDTIFGILRVKSLNCHPLPVKYELWGKNVFLYAQINNVVVSVRLKTENYEELVKQELLFGISNTVPLYVKDEDKGDEEEEVKPHDLPPTMPPLSEMQGEGPASASVVGFRAFVAFLIRVSYVSDEFPWLFFYVFEALRLRFPCFGQLFLFGWFCFSS